MGLFTGLLGGLILSLVLIGLMKIMLHALEKSDRKEEKSQEIVKRKHARGEIDAEESARKKKDLVP